MHIQHNLCALFGHFLELSSSGRLDVAYVDSPKWSHGFGDVISHVRHSQHIYARKKNKIVVFDYFLGFGWYDCSDMHMLIVLDGLHDLLA